MTSGTEAEPASIPAMFFARAEAHANEPRYMAKIDGAYRSVSWSACRDNVLAVASALLDLGLRPNDRIAILASTRPEWMEADVGALSIACVTIPIYPSNLPAECGYILVNSGARTIFVENAAQADKIRQAVRDGIDIEDSHVAVQVDRIVVMDGQAEGCLTWPKLLSDGRARLERNRAEIERRTAAISEDQLATIVYTSGTTGLPKGVVQTHGNHLAALHAIREVGMAQQGDIDFAFLPLAHSFGRMMEYLGLYMATVTAYAEKIDTLVDDIAMARPHVLPSVPRIYEKVYAGIQQAREASGVVSRRIFDWAVSVGEARAQHVNEGKPVPAVLSVLDAVAHRLVFRKIHARLGGRMKFMVSGGAPLSNEINRFFHAVGLPILEGYGLTETTPILTCNRPGATRIGTVGPAIPGVKLRIAEDGEILAKGPNVAREYYERPTETAEAWDAEGWFHTGDIGELEDGMLRITDRKKELIKTAGGKYVAPQKIENLLKARPLISQAVVIGDRLKYCVALLTLDPDAVRAWASGRDRNGSSIEKLAEDPELVGAVESQVAAVNKELASFESIKYFRILPRDFSIESGELTPSLKIKRKVIAQKYADLIQSMV